MSGFNHLMSETRSKGGPYTVDHKGIRDLGCFSPSGSLLLSNDFYPHGHKMAAGVPAHESYILGGKRIKEGKRKKAPSS